MQLFNGTRARAGLFAVLAVLVTPALLLAHARLVRSTPGANGRLVSPPTSLSLWFSEQPELRFTTLQLLDSAGTAIPLGAVANVTGDAMGIAAPITGTIAAGRYTVVWRTAAADGHASSGRFSFVVVASPTPAVVPSAAKIAPDTDSAAAPAPSSTSNAVTSPSSNASVSSALRWAELVALITLVGAMVVRLAVLREANLPAAAASDAADRIRRLSGPVLLLFAIASVWRVAAESDLLAGASSGRFDAMLTVVRDTQWGHGWAVGGAGIVLAAIGLVIASESLTGWIVASVGVIAMCVGEALTGHAGALPHRVPLAIAVDVAHVLSAGGWLGGLAVVLMCGLPAVRKAAEGEQRRVGRQLVRAYHHAAIQCVPLVLITAFIASWLRLTAFSDLWTTPYGSMLYRKAVFVLIALGFGIYHWKTVVMPEWGDDTRFRFQRSATAELLVGAVILAVTALLVTLALPRA